MTDILTQPHKKILDLKRSTFMIPQKSCIKVPWSQERSQSF